MKKNTFAVAMLGLALTLASGCQMMKSPPPEVETEIPVSIFNFEGLPGQEFYVGGGYIIRYRAREDGVLYIAEDETKRLLATISLVESEKYEIVYDINDEDMASNLKAVGIDPEKSVIKVYFVPKKLF